MLLWISTNIATILISIALMAVVVGIIIIMYRDRKKGKCVCGGNCGHCPMGSSCQKH